ncbi:MAG: hypothetical protein ACN4GW_04545 [Desulforhopalus sp.]
MMKIMLLIATIMLAATPVSASEYSAAENEWLFIPVMLPEAKVGGGDFYNLQLELVGHADPNVEYKLQTDGVKLRSENAGIYQFRLVVNHVVKSSCAGVTVSEYSNDPIVVQITR